MRYEVPEEMLACQVVEYNQPYKILKVPVPKVLGPYDLLVKVAVSGFCHTDEMVRQGVFRTKLPCIGSHEGAGTVAGIGSSTQGFGIGDRVLCSLVTNLCGDCPDCLGPENRRQYCAKQGGAPGITRDGMFAEYAIVDGRTAAKLPDAIPFETAAPLACAGCTIWRGITQCQLKPGDCLAIVGSGGGVGHIGIKFAKAMGLNVIGLDARDEGLKLSRLAGADTVVDARRAEVEVVAEVMGITDGKGADATINVSDAEGAAGSACAITRKHGIMIQIAQPQKVSIPFQQLVFRNVQVQGSLLCSPRELQQMLEFVAHHKISVDTVTFYGLEEVPNLLNVVHSGKLSGKGIVVLDRSRFEEEKTV